MTVGTGDDNSNGGAESWERSEDGSPLTCMYGTNIKRKVNYWDTPDTDIAFLFTVTVSCIH